MPSAIFEVKDGELLIARFRAMGRAVERRVAREALKAGGAPMLAAVARGIHSATGLLARGLKLRAGRGDRPGRHSVYIASTTTRRMFARKKGRPDVLKRGKAADRYAVYYGRFVEFGHRIAGGRGRVPEHPFVRPGFEATVDQSAGIIEGALIAGAEAEF